MSDTPAKTAKLLGKALAPEFKLLPLSLPELPIFLAAAWPTHDGVTGAKPRLPAGRGMTLPQALLSAGAEAMELRASLAQNHAKEHGKLAQRDGKAMARAKDMLSGEETLLPAQQVFLDFATVHGEVLDVDADSTGSAAGMTRHQAVLNALLECIERDAMALWWHGETQRPALPLELIDAQQPRLFWWLQKRMRKTLLLDLTQDSGVPVVAAVSGEDDGKWVAVGTAAKLTVDAAALSAVSEMIQTEIAMSQALAAKDPGIADWSDQASMRGMTQFQPLPMAEAPRKPHEGLKSVLAGLAASHHRAHVVDLTLQGDLLHTVRVVAPGLCAMQGRINSERFRSVTGRDFDFQKLAHEKRLEPF